MNDITGRLENWRIQKVGKEIIYWGDIYSDSKMRFKDGARIHTSLVLRRDEDIIYTLTSIYKLGEPSGKWPEESYD